jgi:alpha-1,2-mannosyltransferase
MINSSWVRSRRNTIPDAVLVLVVTGVLAWWLGSRFGGMVDLSVYREAGRVVLSHPSAPESLYSPQFGSDLADRLPFTYPPFAALLFWPLALLPDVTGSTLFTAVSLAVLIGCVLYVARPLLSRAGVFAPVLTATLVGFALLLEPVTMTLGLGQINLVLMAGCLADCVAARPRWPRGLFIGIATAIKLTPGIFIVYLWLTGRRTAAITAAGTTAVCTAVGAVLRPGDSVTFWTHAVFDAERLRDNSYYYNQSLRGVALRLLPDGVDIVIWLGLAALVAWVGLGRARSAYEQGDGVAAVTMVGMVAVLVSPVAWIHHATWVVLALIVMVDTAVADPMRRRSLLVTVAVVSTIFLARLPQLGHDMRFAGGPAALTVPLENLYAVTCLTLLLVIPIRGAGPPADKLDRSAPEREPGLTA